MRGPESKLWNRLKTNMETYWSAYRHEEFAVPDVSYSIQDISGWIELKVVPEYPKRGGVVRVHHYKPWQKSWMLSRARHCDHCFCLLQVAEDYYLFHGKDVLLVGYLPKIGLVKHARSSWFNTLNYKELADILGKKAEGPRGKDNLNP